MLKAPWNGLRAAAAPALGLLLFRLLLLAALPYEAVVAYGDLRHFHQLAELAMAGGGLPFIGHWIEFPPLFPFLSVGLNSLTGGSEHAYVYALATLIACLDAANLLLLTRLLTHLPDGENPQPKVWIYFAFLCLPALGWWTFDPLGVFWLLLTLVLVFESGWAATGLVAGLGMLTKWLPGLGLLFAWTRWPKRRVRDGGSGCGDGGAPCLGAADRRRASGRLGLASIAVCQTGVADSLGSVGREPGHGDVR